MKNLKTLSNCACLTLLLLTPVAGTSAMLLHDCTPPGDAQSDAQEKNQEPAANREVKPPITINETLRTELLDMLKRGQAARVESLLLYDPSAVPNDAMKQKLMDIDKRMAAADTENTKRMKEIIERYGWPGISLVGKDGAHAVFMLVQHSDNDPEFQARCLPLLKKAIADGEASSPSSYALLTDRVLTNQGKKQIYGTQLYRNERGEMVPQPLEDPENVNSRRAEVGLDSLEEYIAGTIRRYREFREKNRKQ